MVVKKMRLDTESMKANGKKSDLSLSNEDLKKNNAVITVRYNKQQYDVKVLRTAS